MSTHQTEATIRFIRRAEALHGSRYDYSKAVYSKADQKIEILCPVHGSFNQSANSHLGGRGCTKCGRIESHRTSRISAANRSVSIAEAFFEQASVLHKGKYDYSRSVYANSHTKIEIICKEHDSFYMSPSNHLYHKQGCPSCNAFRHKERSTLKMTKARGRFIDKLREIHESRGLSYSYDKVDYRGAHFPVVISCYIHGDFSANANTFLSQRLGCPKCVGRNRTISELLVKFKEVHGDRWDYSKVATTRVSDLITIICNKHGEFTQRIVDHLHAKAGCSRCKAVISKAHYKLIGALTSLGFLEGTDFMVNDREVLFNPLSGKYLELDIYFPEQRVGIEVDGILYHGMHKNSSMFIDVEKTKTRDAHKESLCLANNIKLLRVTDMDIQKTLEAVMHKIDAVLSCY